jgi:hypothetical protein
LGSRDSEDQRPVWTKNYRELILTNKSSIVTQVCKWLHRKLRQEDDGLRPACLKIEVADKGDKRVNTMQKTVYKCM